MSEVDVLKELGLSDAEVSVYLTLLETGSTLVGPVIKKTGLHRGTTYQVLQRLMEKGIVSVVIKGKKQHFQAVEPERLLDVIKEREENLKEIIPLLQERIRKTDDTQVTVHYGFKGIRSVMNKMLEELNPDGEYVDFGSSGLFRDVMKSYWDTWQRKKKKFNIKSRVTFSEALKKKNPALLKDYVGKARFHPKEYTSPTDTMIYNDTVILFIWSAKPPVAVVIKDKNNAKGYKNQFELLWKQAKK